METSVIDWLLGQDEPSVRYLALTRLLDRPARDGEVRAARARIGREGWAAEILARQDPAGWWVEEQSLYRPKYLSTNWMLLVLADLGLTRADPRIAKACELWLARFTKPGGGFGADRDRAAHLCVAGNTARALVQFGYEEHPAVRGAFEWFVAHQDKNGGWSCFGSGRNLDSWEPLSAFAVYPRARWTPEMRRAVERGAEFFLERELHRQGAHYEPWFRTHYPVHYYYDLLVGLDFMTALGYGGDPRLAHALDWLRSRRRRDGRWNLDAVHPDVGDAMREWFAKHPKQTPTPFTLETPGRASKMITLRALLVLRRVEAAAAKTARGAHVRAGVSKRP
ncbi:MAG: hypothetical protein KBD01_12005 [Acidobacteria bacterium]|nr:hypothetical protein [Acidobacteriota bacterium]